MYPHERSLVTKLSGKPFVLLGVNCGEEKEKVKAVVEKEQMTWRSWWDADDPMGPISISYNISHLPTIYVIDHEGVIRYIDVRGKKLDDAIDELLAQVEKKQKDN
jgi:hypothetical protein